VIRRARDALRRYNDIAATDDARLWAEVMGAILAPGLLVRAAVHVWAALAADAHLPEGCDPRLAATDITLASPIQGLRGHRLDPGIRVVTALAGVGMFQLWWPLPGAPIAVKAWFLACVAVPVSDPVQYAVYRVVSDRTETTE